MPQYKPYEVEACFDSIWSRWPNRSAKHESMKAMEVCIKQGALIPQIELAADLYILENRGLDETYVHRLSNFLMKDIWKDWILDENGKVKLNIQEHIDHLKREEKTAQEIIQKWNQTKPRYWCECLDIETRIPLVRKSLHNEFFQQNWKKGLDLATRIFHIQPREDSPHSKILFHLGWFCDISAHKHTVLRILEGYYGYPSKEIAKVYHQYKDLTQEQVEQNRQLMSEIFGSNPKDDIRPNPPSETPEVLSETSKFTEKILEQFEYPGFD